MGRAWPVLIVLGFSQLCSSWGALAIIAVQVEMRADLGISTEDVAALVWVYSFSLAIGAIAAQVLIGHWSRRAVLLASLCLLGVAGTAMGLAQSWEQAMVARVAMALGGASVMPTASMIAGSLVSEEHRPAALSVVFAGLTGSTVIALPLSSFIGEAFGWRMTWFVAGGAAFTAALAAAIGVPGGIRGARASLSAMLSVLSNRATSLTIATSMLLLCGGFLTYSMMGFWFVEVAEAPRAALTPALLVSGVASMIGNALSSRVVRAAGRNGTILGGLGFTMLCYLILWAAPHVHLLSYPAFVLFGVGWSLCLAPLQSRLMEAAGPLAQLALAVNASGFFAGQGIGAAAGGAVYDAFGPVALPLASVFVLALATMVYFLSRRA